MKTLVSFAVALLLFTSSAWAASKTVTLAVSNMTCATCPITVKRALLRVEGVAEAKIDFDKKQAVVTFDDDETNVAALIKATTDAGYPSRLAARGERPSGIRPSMHPRWRCCSSFKYGPIFSVVAPCQRGASPVSVLAGPSTTGCRRHELAS